MHSPAVYMSTARTVDGDLSAGVRVERPGEAFSVWLVTPESTRWDPARVGQPLSMQLARLRSRQRGLAELRPLKALSKAPRLLR